MPKKIHAKLYDKSETFKTTLLLTKFWGSISFTETINYGLGNLNFRYYVDFADTTFAQSDIIKVYQNGTNLIYQGFIIGIKRVIDQWGMYLDITCIGMQAALNMRMYAVLTLTKTDDPANIIADILDTYNADPVLTPFSYSGTTIPLYGATISIDFDKDTCWSAIKKVLDTVDRNIRFLAGNEVSYKGSYSSHKLDFESEISQIVTDEKSDQLFNDYIVQWSGGLVYADDVPSQAAYGRREKYVMDTSMKTNWTGDERAAKELADTKDVKLNTYIIVNSNYDIESIHCGDTISIFNTGYSIMNKKVVKIEYEVETARVYVDDYDSIEKALSGL